MSTIPLQGNGVVLTALPPLSLYIHIPWCLKKCPYCDFNSHEQKPPATGVIRVVPDRVLSESEYIDCLIADLEAALPKVWGRRVHTVFFGGGTPSLFSAAGIDRILSAVRARLPLEADAEITLEANPGTFEAEKFKGFREAGVNRLSIGIQSFNAEHLKALGRVHDDHEAKRAIEIAQDNFDNINLDLMFALPEQTLEECARDVETALSFGTQHISLYHLTLEPNTLFHRFPPKLPDDELAADMEQMIGEKLQAAGYGHYETSAYAKPGRECRHNLNYWRFGDYLGIGAGAHGKISFPGRITREMRYKQPRAYMEHAMEKAMLVGQMSASQGTAIQELKDVSRAELPFEFMMNALRLTEGFPLARFTERTGLSVTAVHRQLEEAEARGLITRDHTQVAPTERGRLFLNDLLEIFLPTK